MTTATASPDPSRVRAFASFFKGYMSISTLVVAALPLPLTGTGAIPTYDAQRWVLASYSSLFCFLLLGFIFYNRHRLARLMFPEEVGSEGRFARFFDPIPAPGELVPRWRRNLAALYYLWRLFLLSFIAWLPALLIAAALYSAFRYHQTLQDSTLLVRADSILATRDTVVAAALSTPNSRISLPDARAGLWGIPDSTRAWDARLLAVRIVSHQPAPAFDPLTSRKDQIPFAGRLMFLHLSIFLLAEAALIMMALKEYLQDLLHLGEVELITGRHASAKSG